MSSRPNVQRIILTGFMGSGKTTVGRLLAHHLGWQFLDLDREVEQHAGLSVPEIFAQHGEAHFRELEAEVLERLLPHKQMVLALGGGAPEFAPTAEVLRRSPATFITHLAAPFSTLAERCRLQGQEKGAVHRPLFEDQAAAQARFARREPLYRALAHATVATESLSAEESVTAVLEALRATTLAGNKSTTA